ncbi:MAG: helix-turn-helix transcriptional regulator [Geothermobacteraceae bacterium]
MAATAALSLLIILRTAAPSLLLPILGFAAAPMAVDACRGLLQTPRPVFAAACCLIAANLGLVLLTPLSHSALIRALVALLPVLVMIRPTIEPAMPASKASPWANLAFLFSFQIVSGLMYGSLFPAYSGEAFFRGLELLFYIGMVPGAFWLWRRDSDLLLLTGLSLAMLAFAFLHLGGPVPLNLSMWTMQAAAGCMDLFLLALVLQTGNPTWTVGLCLAVYCGGIAAGEMLSQSLAEHALSVGLSGGIALHAAALVLLLKHHHRIRQLTKTLSPAPAHNVPALPPEIRHLLSDRECSVLSGLMSGKNYRQVAEELGISESSVKTYMKRIYDKCGVNNRRGLLKYLGLIKS